MDCYARPVPSARAVQPWRLGLVALFLVVVLPHLGAGFAQNVWLRVSRRPQTVVQFPMETPNSTVHDHFMGLALDQAKQAARRGEVPIGALVVVRQQKEDPGAHSSKSTAARNYYEILAAQHNRVEMRHDASAHAELLALRAASGKVRNWRLPSESTLYSTLEPCAICLSAAQAFRVSHIVYGAPDHRLGAATTHLQLLGDAVPPHPFHTISSVVSGIRDDECGALLRSFFRKRRKQSKQPKQSANANAIKSISKRWRRLFFWRHR